MVNNERVSNSSEENGEVKEMKRKYLNMLAVLTVTLIFTACGGKEDESHIRDAVEEVVTREFKIYERTKESLADIQKTSHENRKKELDLLK